MTNELFKIVDPENGMERAIFFNTLFETFYFHLDGNAQPMASYKPSPEGIKNVIRVFKKTHSGANLLSASALELLEGKLNKFVRERCWEDIQKLRSIVDEFEELQRIAIPVPA